MNTLRAPRRDTRSAAAPAEPLAAPRRRPDLRIVDSERAPVARRRPRGMVIAVSVAVVTIFLALFGLVVFHTVLVQHQSRLDDLDSQLAEERDRGRDLSHEIAELESPDRIRTVAEQELGLIPPPEVLMLEPVDAPPAAAGTTP
jgi:cell division protein FtsL